jgi:regulatory protein
MPFGNRGKRAAPLAGQALRDYGLRLLGGRSLSIGELRQKLIARAADAAEVDPILTQFREWGYVDDGRFAEHFAAIRKERDGFGAARVLRDLRTRRVPGAVAAEAVEQAFAGADETELARQFLERKLRGADLAVYLKEDKHLASAFRKLRTAGFSGRTSIAVLKAYAAGAERLDEIPLEAGDADPEF